MIMKKFFAIIAVLLSTSCTQAPERPQEYSQTAEQNNQPQGDSNIPEGSLGPSSKCEDTVILKEIVVDGKKTVVEIPVLCEDQSIDKGDPAPENNVRDDRKDPSQLEMNVQVEQVR